MLDLNSSLKDVGAQGDQVRCFFRNLEDHLVTEIDRADVVVGCVMRKDELLAHVGDGPHGAGLYTLAKGGGQRAAPES